MALWRDRLAARNGLRQDDPAVREIVRLRRFLPLALGIGVGQQTAGASAP